MGTLSPPALTEVRAPQGKGLPECRSHMQARKPTRKADGKRQLANLTTPLGLNVGRQHARLATHHFEPTGVSDSQGSMSLAPNLIGEHLRCLATTWGSDCGLQEAETD
jgi:hypothetical protein